MIRLQIVLAPWEAEGLVKLANANLRDPREQIRHILRKELRRAGLLAADTQNTKSEQEGSHE